MPTRNNPPFPGDARRRWLAQAGALASSVALPSWSPGASAQSASTLNALPRIALVIGNSQYAEAPLRNPGNDAKGVAGELRKLGFQVNLRLDAGRDEMLEAIRAFGGDLEKKKGVGMFYYAGHGAQLAWKNYLIPVDALIDRIEDMQSKAVELNSLLEGLTRARNPMNVIILDACRDNPFGSKIRNQQRGLSQFDAPPGSLLAYATSPGRTAADGEGANGLYTENLLRELNVAEAKIEDVFKRVRLNVRRRSEGQQIPWESTSLEEDFYFLPPQQIRKLSEQELEKQFDEQLKIWESIKTSTVPEPLEQYLRAYPSGQFSELAQFQLDRVLREREARLAEAETARLAQQEKQQQLRLAEERRLDEEKRLLAEKRLADERRVAQEKRLADEKHLAELTKEKRLAEEKRLAAERELAEARRIAEEQKLADERRVAGIEEDRAKSQARALSPEVAALGPNPFSKGTARLDYRYKIGDSYTYRETDLFTGIEHNLTQRITEITDSEVRFNNGRFITDLLGNTIKTGDGRILTQAQQFIPEYSVGKKWTTGYRVTSATFSDFVEFEFKVVTREKVTVPAGTFDAFRVDYDGWSRLGVRSQGQYWIAQEIRRPVAMVHKRKHINGKVFDNYRRELAAYTER